MLRLKIPGLISTLFLTTALVTIANSAVLDLTVEGSQTTANDAIFFQFFLDDPTGTGLIDPFVRIQNKDTAIGYNTDGELEFDEKAGSFTHSLQLPDVPLVNWEGELYREFLLDINEANGKKSLLSLDELMLFVEDDPDLSGYPDVFSSPVYNLDAGQDNWIVLDYSLGSGSGRGDMLALIPDSVFGTDELKYVYLYSAFGQNNASTAGFEEWAVSEEPEGFTIRIPEPGTLLLTAGGILLLLRRKNS